MPSDVSDRGDGPFPVPAMIEQGYLDSAYVGFWEGKISCSVLSQRK